nr:hypothetical protein L203_05175 [Cryptococcus depauperatus CBS 7841]
MSSTSSATPTSSASATSSSNDSSSPGSFYKNLFYILIGLLVAFSTTSFLVFMRARRRRHTIIQEASFLAERLGLIIPGMPGYISMRDRRDMMLREPNGKQSPAWWEIESIGDPNVSKLPTGRRPASRQSESAKSHASKPSLTNPYSVSKRPSMEAVAGEQQADFQPLALIPTPPPPPEAPAIPKSTIPFFPNHLAYRPESFIPPPARFDQTGVSNLDMLDSLIGEEIQVAAVVRMPAPTWVGTSAQDESEHVLKEWGGIEIGIATLLIDDNSRPNAHEVGNS